MTYKAFLSYSHAVDDKLAPALQTALHRFAKPFYRLRSIRIFRDKSSLRLTPELWPAIQQALSESEYFLLMASPEAANSRWVQSEVDEWLKLHRGSADKILLILTEGEVVWENSANDFDWDRTTALPVNLRGAFKREPLYSDLRWARKSTDLSLRNPQFLEEIGSLGATLHGKSKDEMIGEDVQRHRLFKLVVAALSVVLLTLTIFASGTAFYALNQKSEAERQTVEAVRQKSEAERQRQSALEFAEGERRAAENERLARKGEKEQRDKAEQASRNEKTARKKAEEKQREAENQRRLADQRRVEAERERNIATSRELASAAASQLSSDPELSLLLSLKAHDVTPTFEAEESMRLSVLRSHVHATYRDTLGVVPSPDWKWLVVSNDHKVKATELATGQTINLEGEVRLGSQGFVRFSSNGNLMLVHYRNFGKIQSRIVMWEVGTWHRLNDIPIQDYVKDAHFSPDSKLIKIDTVHGKTTKLFNLASSSWVEINEPDLSFSPDSMWLIGKGPTSTRLWNTATGQKLWEIDCATRVHVFSSNSNYVVLPCNDQSERLNESMRVIEVASGMKAAELYGLSGFPQFSADGKWLVAVEDKSICVLQVGTWQKVATLGGDATDRDVSTFTFSPDGRWLVSACTDRTILVWQVANWQMVDRLRDQGGRFLRFSDNSKVLVTTGEDDSVSAWQVGTWRLITTLQGHFTPLWGGLALSPDGEHILTSHYGYQVRLWKVTAEDESRQITGPGFRTFGEPPRMLYSPDSRYVAIDTSDGVKLVEIETVAKVVLARGTFLAFSPDGKYVFTKGAKYSIQVWFTSTGEKVAQLEGHTNDVKRNDYQNDVREISFSPNGKWVVTAGGTDRTARIWEIGTWRSVVVLNHPASVSEAVFSPDSEWLITSDENLNVFKVGLWQKRAELLGYKGTPQSVSFSSDGRRVLATAGGSDRAAWIWEVGTWHTALVLRGHSQWVTGAQFSPDSKRVLTWSWDNTARVWDAITGETLAILAGDPIPWRADHPNKINSASFSPDGKLIETASGQTVRIWKADNGQLVRILPVLVPGKDVDNGPRTVNGAIFSPDGRSLLAIPNVGFMRIYRREAFAPIDEILTLARRRATRELNVDERKKYLHEVVGERKLMWSTH